MSKQNIFIGDRFETNNYGFVEVVEYIKSIKVKVRFDNTGYEKYCAVGDLNRGSVKDDSIASFCGVGYLGVGKHAAYRSSRKHAVHQH